jgi:3-oxoadipate enol-lactonase
MAAGLRMRIGTRRARRRAFLGLIYPPGALPDDTGPLAASCGELFGRDLADQPPILLRQMSALRRHDCTADLGRIAAPTLVVSAEHDPIAPPRFGRALARAIPGARFLELKGKSHGVPIEDPVMITRLLSDHIALCADQQVDARAAFG